MKKGGKKNLFVISILLILLLGIMITAQGAEKIRDKIASSIADNADKYIEKFVDRKKIDVESITNVTELNFENLPPEINVGDVKDSNIAFYEIDFEQQGKSDKLFVVSYLTNGLQLITPFETKNVTLPSKTAITSAPQIPVSMNFGFAGEMTKSGFLDSFEGEIGSIEKGYLMADDGDIANVSTNLEVYEVTGDKTIRITLYKNGAPTSLATSFLIDPDKLIVNPNTRSYFVYGILSRGNVPFKKGDIISVYVTISEDVVLKSIATSVRG